MRRGRHARPLTPRKRPLGLSVLCVLLVLVGALIAAPVFLLAMQRLSVGDLLGALLLVLVPQALILGGLGMWFLKPWGVYLTVAASLYFGYLGARFIWTDPNGLVRGGVVLAVVLAILVYLTRPHVKDAFRASGA